MQELSIFSQITFYVLLALMGFLSVVILSWQIEVIRGRSKTNPDGSRDDYHEQKILYGIAVADIFLACPIGILGVVLVFISPRMGSYLLAWVSFWFVWANIVTTATSLKFENPRISLKWFIFFPFGSLVGLGYIAWTVAHFDSIYVP